MLQFHWPKPWSMGDNKGFTVDMCIYIYIYVYMYICIYVYMYIGAVSSDNYEHAEENIRIYKRSNN